MRPISEGLPAPSLGGPVRAALGCPCAGRGTVSPRVGLSGAAQSRRPAGPRRPAPCADTQHSGSRLCTRRLQDGCAQVTSLSGLRAPRPSGRGNNDRGTRQLKCARHEPRASGGAGPSAPAAKPGHPGSFTRPPPQLTAPPRASRSVPGAPRPLLRGRLSPTGLALSRCLSLPIKILTGRRQANTAPRPRAT